MTVDVLQRKIAGERPLSPSARFHWQVAQDINISRPFFFYHSDCKTAWGAASSNKIYCTTRLTFIYCCQTLCLFSDIFVMGYFKCTTSLPREDTLSGSSSLEVKVHSFYFASQPWKYFLTQLYVCVLYRKRCSVVGLFQLVDAMFFLNEPSRFKLCMAETVEIF